MKKQKLTIKEMMIMVICLDLGLFSKRIISLFTNPITDALHVPGGISTSFSLMFLIIARSTLTYPFAATIMAFVQGVVALGIGMVGSMGALTILAYVIPGMAIDLSFYLFKDQGTKIILSNMLAALSASLFANFMVFQLHGATLVLYLSLAMLSGMGCGYLGYQIIQRIGDYI